MTISSPVSAHQLALSACYDTQGSNVSKNSLWWWQKEQGRHYFFSHCFIRHIRFCFQVLDVYLNDWILCISNFFILVYVMIVVIIIIQNCNINDDDDDDGDNHYLLRNLRYTKFSQWDRRLKPENKNEYDVW